MVSNSFGVIDNGWSGLNAPAVQPMDRRWCIFQFSGNAVRGAKKLTSRRRAKNSGGGIAPAANAGLIEGAVCSVNAFRPCRNTEFRPKGADKVLMRLNFCGHPANGYRRSGRGI
jgi:hypothetical protein